MFRYIFFIGVVMVIGACGRGHKPSNEEPLAKVYDKFLYPSDLKGIIQANMSKEDSILVVGTFIENWAKKNLMLKVAEKNIPKDIDLDAILAEYKASLVQHYYEKSLSERLLDSLVSDVEIQTFYEATKDEHVLKDAIARCFFITLPINAVKKEDVKKWWKMENNLDYAKLKEYCETYAINYSLEDSSWVNQKDLAAQLPDGTLSQGLSKGQSLNIEKEGVWYLLKVKEVMSKGQQAPVSYVRDKAIRYILHKRKIELVDNIAAEMYQRELNKKNVIIYK
jgi:hypothetical protein